MSLREMMRRAEINKRSALLEPEKGDFRLLVEFQDEIMSVCGAGINGRWKCKHYLKGCERLPETFDCAWFDYDTHDCLRPSPQTIR